MKKVSIFALREDRKAILEGLQAIGIVEIESEKEAKQGFVREDKAKAAETFDRASETAAKALKVLDESCPEKKGLLSSLSGRREVTIAEFDAFSGRAQQVLSDCNRVIELDKERVEAAAEILRKRVNIAQLEPWKELDVPFCFDSTEKTAAFIGTLPRSYTEIQLAEQLAAADNEIVFDIEIVSTSPSQTCIFVICPIEDRERMQSALRMLGFARPVGGFKSVPKDKINRLNGEIEQLYDRIGKIEDEICSFGNSRRDFEFMADYYRVRAEKYRVIGNIDHTENTFVITGYIAECDCKELDEKIGELSSTAFVEYGDAGENAPIKLKNNGFAAPAESVVKMYSVPNNADIDPTPVMSFFFYFFFGMMFSDAGYGLMMVLAIAWAIRKFRPETEMYKTMKLFQYCGISTFLWGLFFGSFFGDAPTVIASTFFGTDFVMPRVIDSVKDSVVLLGLSIGLGYVQIMVAIGIGAYICFKRGDIKAALFDNITWIVFWTGVMLIAAGILFGMNILTPIGAVMLLAASVAIVVMGGRESKGGKRWLKGLYGLYGATSYFGDLMSYSRLMALGITTGVMGQVFNMLGTLFGKSVFGIIFMIIIFILGHTINFGLNVLGSYVHTMRLQYVEMFSKFYEGGGREFQPFSFNSKYIRLQEEIK